jgi:hypothetical protein
MEEATQNFCVPGAERGAPPPTAFTLSLKNSEMTL